MENDIKPFKSRFDSSKSRVLLSGGAVLTWLATGKETGGQFSIFEAKGVPGMEPPPHIHANEDETYYLLEGEMLFKVGDREFVGKPGDYVYLPKNVRHEFKVLSPHFRCIVSIYPAGLEHYFEPLTVPHTSDNIPPPSTTPPPPEAMEMMKKLDEQFGLIYFT
ncbi:MAG: cupin domain-containing protein [Bacteroidetes bacterium]|nr:cupin domain-containing protein [Bacteroidota bacterium]